MSSLLIAVIGGWIAGMINTLAGNGSAITLTIFTQVLGLPPNIANGTNRIGILAQSITGSYAFYKHGKLEWHKIRTVIIPFLPGALVGVYFATIVSNEQFQSIFGYLLIALLGLILFKPKRWLQPNLFDLQLPLAIKYTLFFILGFYGGFIQMGMGIFFLGAMVLLMQFSITSSNVIKIVVVGTYTSFVLLIFHWQGLVDWEAGASVAVGQALGGWMTARWASKYAWMEKVTYYLLITIILTAIYLVFLR